MGKHFVCHPEYITYNLHIETDNIVCVIVMEHSLVLGGINSN